MTTDGQNVKEKMDDDFPRLEITTNRTNTDDIEEERETGRNNEELNAQGCNSYLPRLPVQADQVHETQNDIANVRELIEKQSDGPDCP